MFNSTANCVDRFQANDSQEVVESAATYLLIIDSQPASMMRLCRRIFSADAYRIEAVCTGAAALERIAKEPPDVIILDSQLSDQCGLRLHTVIRRVSPGIPVIFLSSARTSDTAIRAMKQGAYDCLFKPLEDAPFKTIVAEALELATQMRGSFMDMATPSKLEMNGSMCGASPAMREVYKSIGRVAGHDVNVLITGESGTGKELVARAIHQYSSRSDAPFLALNCAAIPEHLLESELFGHERGAFSGADRRRIGKFEQYSGGTILLDEIGDMPLTLQAKILRLLQEQTFERIGGNETIRTNVRLIASTHRDLKARAAEEKFRADLYYRLSVFTIHIPPLRERGEDLPTLIRYFLRQYCRELGRELHGIAPEAMDRLQRYQWPGNVRELQSVLKQALLQTNGQVLLPTFLPVLTDTSQQMLPIKSQLPAEFDIDAFLHQRLKPDACNLYADLHRELDRHSLARVLIYTRGNQHTASRVLGIARQTLRLKLRESGLHIKQSVEPQLDLPDLLPVAVPFHSQSTMVC